MFGDLKDSDSEKTVDEGPKTQYIIHFMDNLTTEADYNVYVNGIIANMVEKIVFEDSDAETHVTLSGENIRMLKNLAMSLYLLVDQGYFYAGSPAQIFDTLYDRILKEFKE